MKNQYTNLKLGTIDYSMHNDVDIAIAMTSPYDIINFEIVANAADHTF